MTQLLLVHAFPVNKGVWEPVRSRLGGVGVDVHSIDFFGFGDRVCERPPAAVGLDALGDQVADWIRRSGQSTVVAGLSLGGYVAMNVLRRHGDLLAGLVLADTKAAADTDVAATGRLAFADRAEAEGNGWVAGAMMDKLVGETSRATRPDVVTSVTAMIADTPAESVAWVQRAMAARPDSSALLRGFDRPTLIVVGAEDAISTLDECTSLAAMVPGAELAVIANAGHLSPLEDPAAVADAIASWWATNFGSTA